MTKQSAASSAQAYARIGGALYLFIIIAGLYGEMFVRGKLIVAGNAAATVQNIMTSELLFRSGIVADLLMHVCDLPLMLIFYVLLKPVSRSLSLLAAVFSFLQTTVLVANKLNLVAVVLIVGDANYKALAPQERQAFVSLFLALHEYGFGIGLLFFGVSCLFAGYLIYRSTYLPRTLGALQAIAGVCYLINSLALLLDPAVADKMFPAILFPAFIGELLTALWFLVKGLNVAKWEAKTQADRQRTDAFASTPFAPAQ